MADIEIKQGEAKTIRFTVKDTNGNAVDLSSAEVFFAVKSSKDDDDYTIEKRNHDFDLTNAASGIVTCQISSTESRQTPGNYAGEMRIHFTDTNIDKSADVDMYIEKAVTENV